MSSSWIPTWVAVIWTLAFVAVLVVHLRHAVALTGRLRAWHGTHLLMSLGMVDMFWPSGSMPVDAGAGKVVFVLAAVLVLGVGLLDLVRNHVPIWVWLIAAIDLAAMASMFAMMSDRNEALTLALVAWLVLESVGWATGSLLRLLPAFAAEVPAAEPQTVAARTAGPSSSSERLPEHQAVAVQDPHAHHHRDLRVTLALMSLGMAYMFLAMQYGMPAAKAMTHMGAM